LLINEENSCFTNGYGTYFGEKANDLFNVVNPLSKIENIDVVQKIFNSIIIHYYVNKTSVAIEGGYPCYQKNFIKKFTIPNFSNDEIKLLRSLNRQGDIDIFLIEKYQLSISSEENLPL